VILLTRRLGQGQPGHPGEHPRPADAGRAAAAPGDRGGGEGAARGRRPAPGAHRGPRPHRAAHRAWRRAVAARADREIEALLQLFQQVTRAGPMPAGGALNPTDLLGLLTVARGGVRASPWSGRRGGGGLAGLRAGGLRRAAGRGRSRPSADRETRATLREHGLAAVEVRHAPPAELTVDGRPSTGTTSTRSTACTTSTCSWWTARPRRPDAVARRCTCWAGGSPTRARGGRRRRPTVAPRQGGFGLTEQRRLAGRWTILAAPQSARCRRK
jgi:hypothetical protein